MIGNKTVCLNMIVKNECHVIERALSSVKHLIDYWVIADTGSTDGTQDIIRRYLADIPGELYERPWVNFGHNRNEVLRFARGKGDYFLFIDADDRLLFNSDFVFPELDKDVYIILQQYMHQKDKKLFTNNYIILLMRDIPDIYWDGPVHECLVPPNDASGDMLIGVVNEYIHDGSRSRDPERDRKDIEAFKKAIDEDPTHPRNVFFLAQTYRTAQMFAEALPYYEMRGQMKNGCPAEKYYAMFCAGMLKRALGYNARDVLGSLATAFLERSFRSEALFEMTIYCITKKLYYLGYLITSFTLSLPLPDKIDLFLEPWVYDWGHLFNHFVCADSINKKHEAYETALKLLTKDGFSPTERGNVQNYVNTYERLTRSA